MKPIGRYRGEFRWESVPVEAYKEEGERFRHVSRQVLFGPGSELAGELRYFEVAPDGHTSLERHEHPHAVMILRGAGRVLVDRQVHAVRPYDLVRIGSRSWHQFRADPDAPLGFLCLVDRERDRPERPTPAELSALCADPEVAAFVRV